MFFAWEIGDSGSWSSLLSDTLHSDGLSILYFYSDSILVPAVKRKSVMAFLCSKQISTKSYCLLCYCDMGFRCVCLLGHDGSRAKGEQVA